MRLSLRICFNILLVFVILAERTLFLFPFLGGSRLVQKIKFRVLVALELAFNPVVEVVIIFVEYVEVVVVFDARTGNEKVTFFFLFVVKTFRMVEHFRFETNEVSGRIRLMIHCCAKYRLMGCY